MRSAIARSASGISAIFARTSASPAALSFCCRASAFCSLTRSFSAASSSGVSPLDDLSLVVVRLAGFCVGLIAWFLVPRSPIAAQRLHVERVGVLTIHLISRAPQTDQVAAVHAATLPASSDADHVGITSRCRGDEGLLRVQG